MGKPAPRKLRCAREGCRAWARRDWPYCNAHGRQILDAAEREPFYNGAEPTEAGAAWVQGQWTVKEMRTLEGLARSLETGQSAGMADEIAAARVTLGRLLREVDDPVRLADGVAKAAGVVFKARQLERQAGGAVLAGAATRLLGELGLDEVASG